MTNIYEKITQTVSEKLDTPLGNKLRPFIIFLAFSIGFYCSIMLMLRNFSFSFKFIYFISGLIMVAFQLYLTIFYFRKTK